MSKPRWESVRDPGTSQFDSGTLQLRSLLGGGDLKSAGISPT